MVNIGRGGNGSASAVARDGSVASSGKRSVTICLTQHAFFTPSASSRGLTTGSFGASSGDRLRISQTSSIFASSFAILSSTRSSRDAALASSAVSLVPARLTIISSLRTKLETDASNMPSRVCASLYATSVTRSSFSSHCSRFVTRLSPIATGAVGAGAGAGTAVGGAVGAAAVAVGAAAVDGTGTVGAAALAAGALATGALAVGALAAGAFAAGAGVRCVVFARGSLALSSVTST